MRKIVANIGWIFFDKIFRMAAGILVGIWIARYLGPSDFGILNYAMLFPTILSSIAGLGLTSILMIEYVSFNDDPVKQHSLVSNGLALKLTAGVLMYGLILVLNYAVNWDKPGLLMLINVSGTILILQSSDTIDTYFQAHTKAKLSVLMKLIAFGIATAARVYALLMHRGIFFFVVINIIEITVSYGLIIGAYKRYTGQLISTLTRAIDSQIMRRLVRIAWPVMITEFFIFIYMRVDQFMIESLSTSRELGLYGAVLRLSETWYFIAIAVTTSFYPRIAEFWPNNKEKFYKQYQVLVDILVYISLLLAIFTSFFSNQLISLLYGPAFTGAGIILSVHIWSGIFVFMGVGTGNLMIVENLQKFVLIKTMIGALVNIVLNVLLIPKYGALGASIATLVSYGLSAYGINALYSPSKPVFRLQSRSFINFLTLKWPLQRINF